jgi:hypothetical protein
MTPAAPTEQHPALEILASRRWYDAFEALRARTTHVLGEVNARGCFDTITGRKPSRPKSCR